MISGVREGIFAKSAVGVVTSRSGGWAETACPSADMYEGRCKKVTVLSGALVTLVELGWSSSGVIASCGRCYVVDVLRESSPLRTQSVSSCNCSTSASVGGACRG